MKKMYKSLIVATALSLGSIAAFGEGENTNSIGEASKQKNINIYSFENVVKVISNGAKKGNVVIMNILTQTTTTGTINGSETTIVVNGPTGYYVVKAIVDGKVETEKVFIKQ